jgi:hypothetical protein
MAGYQTHEPPPWLLDMLRVDHDPELDDRENVGSPSNRHLRLCVAAWVLPRTPDDDFDVRGALALYECSGRRALLDAPGRLTVAGIHAEVIGLLAYDPADEWPRG